MNVSPWMSIQEERGWVRGVSVERKAVSSSGLDETKAAPVRTANKKGKSSAYIANRQKLSLAKPRGYKFDGLQELFPDVLR